MLGWLTGLQAAEVGVVLLNDSRWLRHRQSQVFFHPYAIFGAGNRWPEDMKTKTFLFCKVIIKLVLLFGVRNNLRWSFYFLSDVSQLVIGTRMDKTISQRWQLKSSVIARSGYCGWCFVVCLLFLICMVRSIARWFSNLVALRIGNLSFLCFECWLSHL